MLRDLDKPRFYRSCESHVKNDAHGSDAQRPRCRTTRLGLRRLPDDTLMRRLGSERGSGRDEYPVGAAWNSLLAGVLFRHAFIESLWREVLRRQERGILPEIKARKRGFMGS